MKGRSVAGRVTAFLLLAFEAAPLARAGTSKVNFDFFYAALPESGSWRESADYGYVWQPQIATTKADWRPYADGSWSQTDQGWTWVSHEDFGWATYHYGRWAKIPDTGWVWIPGFEWGPAWVAWRASPKFTNHRVPVPPRAASQTLAVESEEVIGWAPLPPEAIFHSATGISAQVEVVCDIGPAAYNFVPAANFGEAALVPWIYRPSSNFGFIGSTVSCTNIAYWSGPGCIWVGGPSYSALRPVVQHPIAQLRLVAQAVGPAPPSGGFGNRVAGDVYVVIAPRITPPGGLDPRAVGMPADNLAIKPPVAGPVLAASRPDRGWAGAPAGSMPVAAVRAQMKQQAADAPKIAMPPPASSTSVFIIKSWAPFAGPPRARPRSRNKRPPGARAVPVPPSIPTPTPPPKKPATQNAGDRNAPGRGG